MTISKSVIDVIVDSIPESVKCSAIAEPEPMFRWFREGSTDVISTDAVHVFKTKIPKRSNGTYICQAHNRHGERNITTYLNVLCKFYVCQVFFLILLRIIAYVDQSVSPVVHF